MEIAVVLVTVTVIAWFLGFLKAARVSADALNVSVVDKADSYTRNLLRKRNGSQQLSDEELAQAANDIQRMEEIRSLFR